MAPPGWVPDRTPPQLVSTRPAELAILPSWKGPVVFRFDERISEQGVSAQTAIVSPDTGRVSVSRHGSEIRVMPRGGWKPDRVYHVVLLPTIKDMFGNQRTAPVEVVFSTGPKIPTTAIAGLVFDRLTGKPVPAALVQAVHLPDSLAYTTASDTAGFYALRYLPEGSYVVRAFDDRNHDRQIQFKEPHGEGPASLIPQRDTVIMPDIALLPGDSTPARFTRVEVSDSLTLRLTFDDYLDPLQAQPTATVTLWRLPDSTAVPVTGPLFKKQLDALRPPPIPDTSAAARAAAARDTSAAGRARAAADSIARARAALAGPAAGQPDTAKPLPTQEMWVALKQPLPPRTRYRVTVAGVTNINGITGGGGTATLETAAPPKPLAVDSAASGKGPGRPAARDTTRRGAPGAPGARPRGATPDTTRPAPRAIPPDTTRPARPATPPDTGHAAPGGARAALPARFRP